MVTDRGRSVGHCHDLRAELGESTLRVTALVVGRRGWAEHLGIGAQAGASPERLGVGDTVPWHAILRIEGNRIVVRDEQAPPPRSSV